MKALFRSKGPGRAEAITFAVLTVAAAIPLWLVDFLPLQDLPQHVAAIRVLASYGDAAFALDRFHTLDLFGTPHVAYHSLGALIARVTGVEVGHRVVLTAVVVATPWSVRALARSTGGDPRVGLLAVALSFGVPMMLGLLPFVAAVPLALFAMAWAVRIADEPTPRAVVGLGSLLVLTFATHVVPWVVATAFIGLIAARWGAPRGRGWVRAVALFGACAPAVVLAIVWLVRAGSGSDVVAAVGRTLDGGFGTSAAGDAVPAEVSSTFADVLAGYEDDVVFYAGLVVAWAGSVLAAGETRDASSTRWRVAFVAAACFAFYLFAPRGYEWIWAIHMRFAWMALLLGLALARFPERRAGRVWAVAAACLALAHVGLTGRAFLRVDADETAGFAQVLDAIPARGRVAGLIYRPTSRHLRFAPFLHAVGWYQARKGGAVMFSFADYPSSPFRFRPDARPPAVAPRWEWQPERVLLPEGVAWYDYVLVHGGPGPMASMPEHFRAVRRAGRWSAWKRLDPRAAGSAR